MTKLITVYWCDIPAQVIAKAGRQSAKIVLHKRFSAAIDQAAMRAGKSGTDAYLEAWRRVSVACGDDLQAAVAAAAEQLERDYPQARLLALARNQGSEP